MFHHSVMRSSLNNWILLKLFQPVSVKEIVYSLDSYYVKISKILKNFLLAWQCWREQTARIDWAKEDQHWEELKAITNGDAASRMQFGNKRQCPEMSCSTDDDWEKNKRIRDRFPRTYKQKQFGFSVSNKQRKRSTEKCHLERMWLNFRTKRSSLLSRIPVCAH